MTKQHISSAVDAALANQEDPLVMYLVVKESLNMGAGKVGAQCAHGAQMLLLDYLKRLERSKSGLLKIGNHMEIFQQWLDTSFRKVVLKADDREWQKIIDHFDVGDIVIVCDAGLTEVEPGTNTVICIWPMFKSQQPKVLKRLQALK